MLSLSPEPLILWMNGLSPDLLTLINAFICYAAVLVAQRLFGAAGLAVYIAVAVIAANVQVIKITEFAAFPEPVALGTVMFASTYFATDVLTEYYGPRAAARAVWLGFAAYLFWTVGMIVTLGYAPLTPEQAGEANAWALPVHDAMRLLFNPGTAIFAASMIAFLTSQYTDIWIYQAVRRLTGGRFLWLRNNASTMLSALVDNIVFSALAWVVFAESPIDWHTLVFTYILGTYLLRVALAVLDTPFMYLSRLAARGAPRPAEAVA